MELTTIAPVTQESATGKMRYRPRQPSEGMPGRVLQQEWRTWKYEGGTLTGHTDEWRDVPFDATGE